MLDLRQLFGKVFCKNLYSKSNECYRIITFSAIYNNQEIALKFVAAKNENNVKTEVENHQVMKAHKNATAEDYGIPDMKYFGRVFNGRVYAIGLTLIESNSERLHMEGQYGIYHHMNQLN